MKRVYFKIDLVTISFGRVWFAKSCEQSNCKRPYWHLQVHAPYKNWPKLCACALISRQPIDTCINFEVVFLGELRLNNSQQFHSKFGIKRINAQQFHSKLLRVISPNQLRLFSPILQKAPEEVSLGKPCGLKISGTGLLLNP